jgi:tRNA A-37 threonylcarbamoyl transferase component Bud32
MTDLPASVAAAPAAPFAGQLGERDLLPLLRLFNRTQVTGTVRCEGTVDGQTVKAQLHLRQGNIRAAFYSDLQGPAALTRSVMMGAGSFVLEVHAQQPPRNISHETGFLLDSIAKVLAESDRVKQVEAEPAAVEVHGESPLSGPATERIVSFHPPQVGDFIGKCKLIREIGHGASSIVFLAHHTALDIDVVVKVLLQDGGQSHHRALTVNEAQLLARLNHPNIVRLYDFDDEGRHPHLVVEFIDGPSLSALLRDRGCLPTAEALPLFCQITEGLAYADAMLGLVHCDLKPENILLTTDHRAKLADFGLAKGRHRGAEVPADVVVGTPSYIAPEQVRGGHAAVDRRSDIYALGATFYHVLTGRPPFVDEDPIQLMLMRLDQDPIPAIDLVPGLDRRLNDLLMSMLARDPARRLDTYDELMETLMTILAASDRKDTAETMGNVIRRRTSFWRTVPNKLFGA